jgi:hypothetical protein
MALDVPETLKQGWAMHLAVWLANRDRLFCWIAKIAITQLRLIRQRPLGHGPTSRLSTYDLRFFVYNRGSTFNPRNQKSPLLYTGTAGDCYCRHQ